MRFVLIALASAVAMGVTSARADIDGDRYSSKRWGVTMRAPSNWTLNERTSYPNILLWMSPRDSGVRLLLSAEIWTTRRDSQTYALETTKMLETLGFTVNAPLRHLSGAYYIDFDNCGEETDCTGKVFLRQAFLVVGNVGYALTLAAPTSRTRGFYLRAWDAALRTMRVSRARPAAEAENPTPASPAPTPSPR